MSKVLTFRNKLGVVMSNIRERLRKISEKCNPIDQGRIDAALMIYESTGNAALTTETLKKVDLLDGDSKNSESFYEMDKVFHELETARC